MVNSQLEKPSLLNQIQENLAKITPPKSEESILLRVLVQAMVIVGIIATDVAAGTWISLWAVPLSIAGATWSWRVRHKKNITLKFILAILMLGLLFSFFGELLANLNDTRLVLAKLLIQLQVLHSFDLPRRKDLGYSMVIGLILLGVAGTVSQTLAFAPLLFLFLALALPTLILDYRSRLGLKPFYFKKNSTSALNDSPIAPKRLLPFLAIIFSLGLLLFAVMPRFAGYQLQTFPVSSPIDVEDKVFTQESRQIVNPGYGSGENGSETATGRGGNASEGPGEVDSTFYYGFNSKMNQNLRGQMEPKLVMRIRSQAAGFWRVLAFDRYTGQGWEISRNENLMNLKRPVWTYRFSLPNALTMAKTREVIQSYSIVSDLPNLIPALSHPRFLFYPTAEIGVDPEGALRSPIPLTEGLTYTVVSQVPYRDRTLLGNAPENYPIGIRNYYLSIPPKLASKIRPVAEALLAKSNKPITSNYEKALFLAQALKQNYTIQPELPFLAEGEDLVEAFLFRYQGGYPDHFSTVLTMMLRSLGIPARLAAGFAPGQFNPFTGYYLVYNTDAYALTEVYFPQYGWFTFDPIPGHEVIPPSIEENQTFGVLKQFWNWVASWLPSPITAFINYIFNQVIQTIIRAVIWLWVFFSSSLLGLFAGLMSLVVVSFIAWLAWQQGKNWLTRSRLSKLPPTERIYQQMLEFLKEKGYPKHPAQTPLEYATSASQNHNLAVAEIVREISENYVRWRYGEQTPNLNYLNQQLQALKKGKGLNL